MNDTPTALDTIELIKELKSLNVFSLLSLKRELNEARLKSADRNDWQEVAMKVSAERDQLRKMVDAFAACGDCGDEWLMADYRELPHVRARKSK
jgi:hypothetical protein